MRWFAAHVAAVLVDSLLITMGVEGLVFGPAQMLGGAGKWLGGILIFSMLAIVTAPFGVGIRFLVGRLQFPPLPTALVTGVAAGLSLIPLLHPAMAPPMSLATEPLGLVAVHSLAGAVGGLVWYLVEAPRRSYSLIENKL